GTGRTRACRPCGSSSCVRTGRAGFIRAAGCLAQAWDTGRSHAYDGCGPGGAGQRARTHRQSRGDHSAAHTGSIPVKNHSALPTPATRISSASSGAATLPTPPPTVALVLGSGGARGYAHMGVIEVLLERGYRIVAISGCSMGAMVGGLYAAGKLHAFKDWATGLGHIDVLRLLDISLSAPGAIRGEKVFSIVRDMIGDVRIEDLPIAYTAVATDLLGHKEIWFQE